MKKSILSILLALLPFVANAEPVEIGGIWYNLVKKAQEAEVTSNPNVGQYDAWFSGSCDIPASVTYDGITYSVTSIGGGAFWGCSGLTSVTIPNSVTSIESEAFSNCSGLTSFTISNSVTSIGWGAFFYCNGLTSVHISDLKTWCEIEFSGFDSNPLSYAHHLYLNGEEIKDLVIPNSVTSIGECAFNGCSVLTSVTIPNSVTSIGSSAFYSCSGLTSVTIPNSVTSIGNSAFYGCSGLTSVTIPNSVTSIGGGAFSNCSGLTSITIPNSVTSIGNYAFSGCSGLTSVTIPNSVTSIGNQAFDGCSSLTSVTISNSVTSIGSQVFANCADLTDVYCMAEKLSDNNSWGYEGLYTSTNAFEGSYPQYITLHVPAGSIEAYRRAEPWSSFKNFVALEGGDVPTIEKCATPAITYHDGKISFSCETEGVDFVSEITIADAKKNYSSEITIGNVYTVTVYATKPGYDDSEKATLNFTASGLQGDVNGDGQVDVADHVKLSEIIMKQ